MKKFIILAYISLILSCKSQEIFLFKDIPLENQVRVYFGRGVGLTELNRKKIKIKDYSTIVVPSGVYRLVLNLVEERTVRTKSGQIDFDRYFYDSYILGYYFEPEKSYGLFFSIEESYFLFLIRDDKWILNIRNFTDKTNENIIIKRGPGIRVIGTI
jgi:hypothetical protein